ncbi:MAG: CRTAC1 family protein [Deltaproteobacteria bacterium]|nr:CRTAC1 family protein [Deltaproteobacteria bacterium]
MATRFLTALLACLILVSCKARPCADAPPTIELEIHAPETTVALGSLAIVLSAGGNRWEKIYEAGEALADGVTTLGVQIDPPPEEAFDVEVRVRAFSGPGGGGALIAESVDAFVATPDGCNARAIHLDRAAPVDGGTEPGRDSGFDGGAGDAVVPGDTGEGPGDGGCGVCPPCSACAPSGGCTVALADDPRCGDIDCDALDDACRDYLPLTTDRCAGLGVCKTATRADCDRYTDLDGRPCPGQDACLVNETCAGGHCSGDSVCVAFTDRTSASGLGDPGSSYGLCFGDVDGDGHLDVVNGGSGKLYRSDGAGAFSVILEAPSGYRGCAFADPDNDGDLDLLLTLGALYYENDGTGAFIQRAPAANLVGNNLGTAAWIDFDRDGWIDLFFPNGAAPFNELRRNNADAPLTFATVGGSTVGIDAGSSNGETCAVADVNGDGLVDIWYNDALDGSLYINDGDGTFHEASGAAGVAIEMPAVQPYYPAVFGDYDNDSDLDLFLGHPASVPNRLYQNSGNGTFTLATALHEDLGHSRGAAFGDYDHDGFLDLLVANEGAPNALYRNNGDGTFTDVAGRLGIAGGTSPTTSAAFVDLDGDGDLDVYFGNRNASNTLFRNELDDDKFLKVRLVGRGAAFSSRDAIGARIELVDAAGSRILAIRELSGGEGYGSQPPLIAHFGLAAAWGGGHGRYTVRVRFPSGRVVTRSDVVPSAASLRVGTSTLSHTIEIDE